MSQMSGDLELVMRLRRAAQLKAEGKAAFIPPDDLKLVSAVSRVRKAKAANALDAVSPEELQAAVSVARGLREYRARQVSQFAAGGPQRTTPAPTPQYTPESFAQSQQRAAAVAQPPDFSDGGTIGGVLRAPFAAAESALGFGEMMSSATLPGIPTALTPARQFVQQARESIPAPQGILGQAAEATGSLVPAVAAGVLTGGVAAPMLVGGALAGGATQARRMAELEAQGMPSTLAGQASLPSSGVSVAIGLASGIPAGRIAQRVAGGIPAGGFIGDVAIGAGINEAQALAESRALAWIEQNPQLWEQAVQNMGRPAAIGALLSAAGAGVGSAIGGARRVPTAEVPPTTEPVIPQAPEPVVPPTPEPVLTPDEPGPTIAEIVAQAQERIRAREAARQQEAPRETLSPRPDEIGRVAIGLSRPKPRETSGLLVDEPTPVQGVETGVPPVVEQNRVETRPQPRDVVPEVETPLPEQAGRVKEPWEMTADELGVVFHGGKNKVKTPRLDKTGKRDYGFYGRGFYTTRNQKYATTYGPVVSEYTVDPSARILTADLKASQSPPALVQAVREWALSQGMPRARQRGKEQQLIAEVDQEVAGTTTWSRLVDRFAEARGYDIVRHSDGEIVVKNPSVLRFRSEGRVGPPPPEVATPPTVEVPPPQEPTPPSTQPTPKVAEEGQPSLFEQTIDGIRQAAEKRIAERAQTLAKARAKGGKRGRLGAAGAFDPADIYDRAVVVAAKAVAAGIRKGKQLAKYLQEAVPEGTDSVAIRRAARAIVESSYGPDGKADDARFELAVADNRPEPDMPATKTQMREVTGQKPNEPDTLTQREALRGSLAAAEKASASAAEQASEQTAFIQGSIAKTRQRQALSKQAEKYEAERQAMREKFADEIETMEAEGKVGEDIRKQLVDVAKRTLMPADVGKVASFIATARAKAPRTVTRPDGTVVVEPTSRDFYTGLRKILGVAEKTEVRRALRETRAMVGSAPRDKTAMPKEPSVAAQINKEMGIKPAPSPIKKGRIDPAALRPEYRQAVEPVIRALQDKTPYTKGLPGLADVIQKANEDGLADLFTDEMLDRLRGLDNKLLSELNPDQVRMVNMAVQHAAKLSDNATNVRVAGKVMDAEKLAADAAESLTGRVRKLGDTLLGRLTGRTSAQEARTRGASTLRLIRRFFTRSQDDVAAMVDLAFGQDSPMYDLGYRDLAKAESKGKLWRRNTREAILKPVEDMPESQLRRHRQKVSEYKLADGRIVRLTDAEAASLVGLLSDPENPPQIAKAGVIPTRLRGKQAVFKVSPEDAAAIRDQLPPKVREVLDNFIKSLNSDMRDKINAATVEAWGIEEALRTNYFPRSRDPGAKTGTLEPDTTGFRSFAESLGILKERTGSQAAIEIPDLFELIAKHTDDVSAIGFLMNPVMEVRRTINRGPLKEAMRERLGDEWLNDYLNRLSKLSGMGAGQDDPNAMSVLNFFTRNTATTALAGNLSSATSQVAGLPVAMTAMSPGEAASVSALVGTNPLKAFSQAELRDLAARSGFFADRYDTDLSRFASGIMYGRQQPSTAFGTANEKAAQVLFTPMTKLDQALAVAIYRGVKDHIAKTEPSLSTDQVADKAAWRTEEIIRQTQNPTSVLDSSGLAIGAERNPMQAMYVMLTSPATKARNILRRRFVEMTNDPSPKTVASFVAAVAGIGVAGFLEEANREAWRRQKLGFREPDQPRELTDNLVNVVGNWAGMVAPKVDEITKAAINTARGKPTMQFDSPAIQFVTAVSRAVARLGKDEDEVPLDDNFAKVVESGVKNFARSFGISGAPVYDHIRGMVRMGSATYGDALAAMKADNRPLATDYLRELADDLKAKGIDKERIKRSFAARLRSGLKTDDMTEKQLEDLGNRITGVVDRAVR